jgi:hypothetical protein
MKRLLMVLSFALAALPSLLFVGCEAESSADVELDLTPRQVTLGYMESATFKVSGGYDYRWSLENETLGQLDRRNGDQVVYAATSTNAGTQILTVQSYIEGASGNSPTNVVTSNQAPTTASLTATIIQTGKGGSAPVAPPTALTITPDSATLTPFGQSQQFKVAGGFVCDWAINNPAYGSPSTGRGNSFTYSGAFFPTSAVTQTITATYTPAAGTPVTASVTVTQRANP